MFPDYLFLMTMATPTSVDLNADELHHYTFVPSIVRYSTNSVTRNDIFDRLSFSNKRYT